MTRVPCPLTISCALLAACADPELDLASSDPQTAAAAAGLTAKTTIDLAGDVGQLVVRSFNIRGGASIGAMPAVGTVVDLDHDITTPGGRRVQGSLSVSLSNACSPFGLEVEYHLLIESDPNSGDMLAVDGSVKLGIGGGALDLSVSLEQLAVVDGHSIRHSINVCLMLDLPSRHVAMNGHVLASIDDRDHRGVRIEDVRAVLCEPLPYQGSVIVEDPDHEISVVFDSATPDTRSVTVNVDGSTSRTELDVGPLDQACDDLFGPNALPATIDYQSCGGCGQPPPATPPGGQPQSASGGSPDL
jgi:hypothetical protein